MASATSLSPLCTHVSWAAPSGAQQSSYALDTELEGLLAGGDLGDELLEDLTNGLAGGGVLGETVLSVLILEAWLGSRASCPLPGPIAAARDHLL